MRKDEEVMSKIIGLIASNAQPYELRASRQGPLCTSMLAAKMAEFGERVAGSSKRSATWVVKGENLRLTLTNGKAERYKTEKISVNRDEFTIIILGAFRNKVLIPINLFEGLEWEKFGAWLKQKQNPVVAKGVFEPQSHMAIGGSLAPRR